MDVRLSPEQQALQDSVRQLVSRVGVKAVGELDDRERAGKLDAAVAATGWRELRTNDGGAPLAGGTEVALVAEELARGLADTAYLGPTLAAELRRLADLAPSEVPETVVMAAGLNRLAVAACGTVPLGTAIDAEGAVAALALTEDDGGLRVIRVPLDDPSAGAEQVDLTRTVVAPRAPAELIDGGVALTADDITRWTALALATTSADLVGTMQGAVDLATGYACERRQYGAPIGSFQAVQHLLADALVATEGSRSATVHAAWAVDALDADEALVAAASAKAYASRAARAVCETAIQVHGGIGNTWECLAHVYLRRALLSTQVVGGAGVNLDRVLAHHGLEGN